MQPDSSYSFRSDPFLLRGEEIVRDAENYHAIIDDQLYLGNLSAAESPQLLTRLGITHVLSACPDYLATAETLKHLTLPLMDDEDFDILEHLPTTCRFIKEALDGGGKVFCHCVMGISRSATVVCAYLMFSQHISAGQAIRSVRTRRPRARPNYSFIRQLQVFFECNYDITPTAPPYIAWKEQHNFDKTNSLRVIDGMPILPGQLFLSFTFPSNRNHADALLDRLGVTHIVTITPSPISGDILEKYVHKHFIVPPTAKESLLLSLSLLCQFVDGAMQGNNSRVLLHCMDEMRGGIAICAYLMYSRHIPPSQALEILQERVPLFDDNPLIRRNLELFEQCQYSPSQGHPLVRAWVSPPNPAVQPRTSSYVGEIFEKGKSLQTSIITLFSGSAGS
ncbi:protein-tyrosine phosphatase-like protein [Mycena leptocephala]|nr:protein-tyrosine phosphatase-like protein [Mycena leptocephala]